jgi:hypothetical protein
MNDYNRGHIRTTFYVDGSGPAFQITRDGQYGGVNERLSMAYKIAPKREIERHGKTTLEPWTYDLTGREPELLVGGTTLKYDRTSGYCDLSYLRIDSDMGRMYGPQEWARGFLPIIELDRVRAFAAGASEDVFRYDWTKAGNDPKVVNAAASLLRLAFSSGFLGAPMFSDSLWLMLEWSGPAFETTALPCNEGVTAVENWLRTLADAFAPYALISIEDVRRMKMVRHHVNVQGQRGGPRTMMSSNAIFGRW